MTKPTTPLKEHGLFSSRDTLEEALEYAQSLIAARIPAEYRMEALTALHVTSNTAIKLLEGRNPANISPMTPDELKTFFTTYGRKPGESFSVGEFSPEDNLRLMRSKLPEMTMLVWILEKAQVPHMAEIGSFVMMVAGMFNVEADALAAEVIELKQKLLKDVFRR